jgi:hypothetical protein
VKSLNRTEDDVIALFTFCEVTVWNRVLQELTDTQVFTGPCPEPGEPGSKPYIPFILDSF